jgi:large subunit ribosomal protein L19
MDLVKVVENEQLKNAYPEVEIGDYVKVHLKIKEGNRERVQVFEGTVIARILPVHSPKIDKIEVVRKGQVRRAKLYFLRDRVGKAAKIKERLVRSKK